LREVIEQVAFTAREDKKVDKRSGVSQRLPIATLELAVSNAERRALLHGETRVVPRVGDLYTALPGITGKLELEYEGEMKGADTVVRDIVRGAIGKVFDRYFGDVNTPADRAVVQPGWDGEDFRRAGGEGDAGGAETDSGIDGEAGSAGCEGE
jgi:Mg-chelatase subunit ChlI